MGTKQKVQEHQATVKKNIEPAQTWKFFVYSFIGIFIFFVPITIEQKSTIMLDHIVSYI